MTIPSDIEVYIKSASKTDITNWLSDRFSRFSETKSNKRMVVGVVPYQDLELNITVLENVVPGFSSLWVNSSASPWKSDQELARDVFKDTKLEVRCTAGSWENEQDPDLWWCISENGEQEIIWKT